MIAPAGWRARELGRGAHTLGKAPRFLSGRVDETPGLGGPAATLRWIVTHLLEEIARHVGHMDIARELLDGRTGR
jgi:Protein of unknown function (DUF664)